MGLNREGDLFEIQLRGEEGLIREGGLIEREA